MNAIEGDNSVNTIAWAPVSCGCPCLVSGSSDGDVVLHMNRGEDGQFGFETRLAVCFDDVVATSLSGHTAVGSCIELR